MATEVIDAPSGTGRALVTGANGFIGSHMVELLRKVGWRVVATDIARDPARHVAPHVEFYAQCDLRRTNEIGEMLTVAGGTFDAAFHVGGLFDYAAPLEALHEANVLGTEKLLRTLRLRGCAPKRFVHWGAGGIYDFARESPAKETTPPAKELSPYLLSKMIGEYTAFAVGMETEIDVTAIRPGAVYGPRSRYGVGLMLSLAARDALGPIYIGPKHTRAATVHVEDVCRAALFLSQRHDAVGRSYNVADGSDITTSALLRECAGRMYVPFVPGHAPLDIMRRVVKSLVKRADRAGRVSLLQPDMVDLLGLDAALDTKKLRELGWLPKHPDPVQGIMQTVAWCEKEEEL